MKRRMIAMGSIAAALFVAMIPQGTVQAAAISVDGDPSEWSGIPMQASSDSRVAKWAVAQDESYVYFYIQENGGNEWGQPISDTNIVIAYADAVAGQNQCGIRFAYNIESIKDDWYADIAGEVHAFSPSLEADRYEVEFAVPKAFFAEGEYVISYCGASVDSGSITDFSMPKDTETEGAETGSTESGMTPGDGQPGSTEGGMTPGDGQPGSTEDGVVPGDTETGSGIVTESTESAGNAYNGITIDGNFTDWAAITKTPVNNGSIVETAMIFDGDYVYIYIKEVTDGCATWSGPYGNGYFAIVTDLGRTTTFKLNKDSITEISGAAVRHSNLCYEIAIPASAIKAYNNTISFGYYEAEEMLVSDVANLKEDGGDKNFNGIIFDGCTGTGCIMHIR